MKEKEIAKLFSKVVSQFYFPTGSVWKFQLFCVLPALGMVSLFNFNHINVHVVISYCGFNLHIPDD